MRRALPWAAAVAVPSALLGVVYLTQGNNPAWGLVAGVIGLVGALSAELAQVVLEHRRATAAPEEISAGKIAAGVLRAELTVTRDDGERVTIPGTSRLRFYPPDPDAVWACCEAGALAHPDPCPWHPPKELLPPDGFGPPDYEPPTRG